MNHFFNDIKYAFRRLIKSPGFTAVAVLTLALGIGVNTSMFTTLRTFTFRPLPYPDADKLVRVFRTAPQSQSWPHSVANFLDYKEQNGAFEQTAAYVGAACNFAEPGQPAQRLRGIRVSTAMFPLLGIQPEMGRMFTEEEEQVGQGNVVILSHGFWMRQFGGDRDILGRTLQLDDKPVTVVGVMHEGFDDTRLSGTVDVWRPLVFSDEQRQNRGWNWLNCVGRLRTGTSLKQARVEMNTLASRLAQSHPETNTGEGVRLVSLATAGNENGRRAMSLIMGLAGFVLLIACANLSNLLFAKTAGRSRELAVRGALGASRRRLLGQLLAESLLIAALGGLLGLIVANVSNELLSRQIPSGPDGGIKLGLDLKALGFALFVATASGLVFGLLPAWKASHADVNEALKQGSRGTTSDRSTHRLRHALVVAEMALALVLLSGAGVLLRGLNRFAAMDPGWRVDGLVLGNVNLLEARYSDGASRIGFVRTLRERLAALPGVDSVTVAREIPLRGFSVASNFDVEGQPEAPAGQKPLASRNGVFPGYIQTLGMRLMMGRDFTDADTADSPAVVIVNEAMARALWPNESPIGRRIGGPGDWDEIVGVVDDVRFPTKLEKQETRFQTYRPFAQESSGSLSIAARGSVSAETLRRVVAEIDPGLPVTNIGSAQDAVERSLSGPNMSGKLLGGFAALGLLLAALGIYGVIAGFVAQRTNEIGVRMALGAPLRDVLWLVIGKGLRLASIGAAVGLIGAIGVARILASISPELKSKDPFTFFAVIVVLLAVAFLSCWLPARRAAKIDPMEALRYE